MKTVFVLTTSGGTSRPSTRYEVIAVYERPEDAIAEMVRRKQDAAMYEYFDVLEVPYHPNSATG